MSQEHEFESNMTVFQQETLKQIKELIPVDQEILLLKITDYELCFQRMSALIDDIDEMASGIAELIGMNFEDYGHAIGMTRQFVMKNIER